MGCIHLLHEGYIRYVPNIRAINLAALINLLEDHYKSAFCIVNAHSHRAMQVPLKDVPCGETLDLWFDMKAPKGKQEKNPLLGGIRVSGRLACYLPACMPSFCGLRLAKRRLTTACDDFLPPLSIIYVFQVCTSPYKCWPLMSGRNTPVSRIPSRTL